MDPLKNAALARRKPKTDIELRSLFRETRRMKLLESAGLNRFGIQLASRGEWENSFAADHASSQVAKEWIAAAGKNVAIESLFCDASGDRRGFIGFRRSFEHTRDRCDFWLDVVEKTKPLELNGPREHIAVWLGLLGQPSLLDSPAKRVELGVWNQWNSAGPVLLHTERLTENDLHHGPDWIRQGATAPICREQQWAAPEDFWIADVVSHKEQERYVLDHWLLPE